MTLDEISTAYVKATGKWKGCDWPVCFGTIQIGNGGVTSCQAAIAARATSGKEAEEWRQIAAWLSQVEHDAQQAECEGRRALELANAGRYDAALAHADNACVLEARYPRPPVWILLRKTLADALCRVEDAPVADTHSAMQPR